MGIRGTADIAAAAFVGLAIDTREGVARLLALGGARATDPHIHQAIEAYSRGHGTGDVPLPPDLLQKLANFAGGLEHSEAQFPYHVQHHLVEAQDERTWTLLRASVASKARDRLDATRRPRAAA